MEVILSKDVEGNYYETWSTNGESNKVRSSAKGNPNAGVFRSTLAVETASAEGNNFVGIYGYEGDNKWEDDKNYFSFQMSEGQALDMVAKVLDVLVNPEYNFASTVDRKEVEEIANQVRNVRRVRTN